MIGNLAEGPTSLFGGNHPASAKGKLIDRPHSSFSEMKRRGLKIILASPSRTLGGTKFDLTSLLFLFPLDEDIQTCRGCEEFL